jgi:ParB/RepB/Spo0J family partition protein
MSTGTGGAVGSDLLDEQIDGASAPVATQDDPEIAKFRERARSTKYIPVSRIRKSDVALRGVQRQSEKYQMLLDSVKKRGVLNSILVREQKDPETGTTFYGLVDGLQRFTAATDAGLTEIPANIVEMDDAEVLETQLITNLNRIETKPADVSKHLLRILSRNPFMTKSHLAERVSQSLTWVEQRLGLADLKDEIKNLVNEGKIHLTNAYALSKIDEDEQMQHVEAAMTESPKTFVPRMKQRAKEIKDARKSGKDAGTAEFTPVQFMQKVGDVKKEVEAGYPVGNALIQQNGLPPDAIEGWKLALLWSLHYDKLSQEEQKREHDRKKAEREAEKARMKEQREKEKQQKAAQQAESITGGW